MASHITQGELHQVHDEEHDSSSKVILGFWLYLMTDAILFATIFAVYAVLQNATMGGFSARDFNVTYALMGTLVFLSSSFISGLAQVAVHSGNRAGMLFWMSLTFLFGALFVGMVGYECRSLMQSGHTWQSSAFLSAYFILIGTLLMHILAGLLWNLVLMVQIGKRGLIASTIRRFTCLRMFWHFLNIVWIFIFTFVYLIGAL